MLQRSKLVQPKSGLQESSNNLRIASDQLGLSSSLPPSGELPALAAIPKPYQRLVDPLLAVGPSRNNAELHAAHVSGAPAWSALPSLHWGGFWGHQEHPQSSGQCQFPYAVSVQQHVKHAPMQLGQPDETG